MSAPKRYLIVNADDFGQSPEINLGIIAAHEEGIVSSTSLMVRWPAAAEAARYARSRGELSVGLHVDLGEWTFRDGEWVALYEVVPLKNHEGIAAEVKQQVAEFRRLVGREPTHIDSHQHVHLREPVRSVVAAAASELRVPLRHCIPAIRYCGDFYGQSADGMPLEGRLTVEYMMALLAALPGGITELACHPGTGENIDSMYGVERNSEVRILTDERLRAALSHLHIELVSFQNAPLANAIDDVDFTTTIHEQQ